MNENLIAVEREAHLSRDELVRLARNAFTISWLPEDARDAYLDELDAYAAAPA
jgi:adenosine deaminase